MANKYVTITPDGNFLCFRAADSGEMIVTEDINEAPYSIDLASAVLNCPYGFSIRCVDENGITLGQIPK